MNKRTVREVDVGGKHVLVRVDFNVPLDDSGRIVDDMRIRSALPTIQYLLERGALILLCSHLGRPTGNDHSLTMRPVAESLRSLIGVPVHEVGAVVGPEVSTAARRLQPGELLLLENSRFEAGEVKNDFVLSKKLAALADVYVNDAFGAAHRSHASTEGVAVVMKSKKRPAVAGFLMEKELDCLGSLLEAPERPFIAIIGGAKISDKIGVIENLLERVDKLLIGGGLANTFLAARGHDVRESLVEKGKLDLAKRLIGRGGERVILPVDVVIADSLGEAAACDNVGVDLVPPGWRIVDIGRATLRAFGTALQVAKTVVWNGPVGFVEHPKFARGTQAVTQMLGRITDAGGFTVIGGGDSIKVVRQHELTHEFSHISTGGGASLELLTGKTLPGVAALDDKPESSRRRRSRSMPSKQELLEQVARVHPKFKPVWDGLPADEQAALAGYFLPHTSKKEHLGPTRPRVVKWYCPFACQRQFPSGHRYCINVFVGCAHACQYCYAAAYTKEPTAARRKRDFRSDIDRDMKDLEAFDVPPAPVHLSNSIDPFQPLERTSGHTWYALDQILAHRHRFTTVTVLTKNPLLPVHLGYVDLFKKLSTLTRSHPKRADFEAERPALQVHVSLAFWNDVARARYDPNAPRVEERVQGIRALCEAGIPLVLRIDPLFPRSPISTSPRRTLQDFELEEAQTVEDLDNLVQFAKEVGVCHVVYSPLKIVKGQRSDTMKGMLEVLGAIVKPDKLEAHGGSWRLPRKIAEKHVVGTFRSICDRAGVKAKFCMEDLLETF